MSVRLQCFVSKSSPWLHDNNLNFSSTPNTFSLGRKCLEVLWKQAHASSLHIAIIQILSMSFPYYYLVPKVWQNLCAHDLSPMCLARPCLMLASHNSNLFQFWSYQLQLTKHAMQCQVEGAMKMSPHCILSHIAWKRYKLNFAFVTSLSCVL